MRFCTRWSMAHPYDLNSGNSLQVLANLNLTYYWLWTPWPPQTLNQPPNSRPVLLALCTLTCSYALIPVDTRSIFQLNPKSCTCAHVGHLASTPLVPKSGTRTSPHRYSWSPGWAKRSQCSGLTCPGFGLSGFLKP